MLYNMCKYLYIYVYAYIYVDIHKNLPLLAGAVEYTDYTSAEE